MASNESQQAALDAVGRYIDGFNRRDAEAMAEAFNFPHVRLAKGRVVTIADRAEFIAAQDRVTRMLREEGWHHTVVEATNVIHCGADKVHIAIEVTRRGEDERVIHRFETLWIATSQDGHWGIQFRSSYLLSDASTLGDTPR